MAHRSVGCALTLLAVCAGIATAQQRPAEPATLARSFQHHIWSARVGDTFDIRVALPAAYRDTTRRFPLIVVLDGDKSFGLARDITDWLEWAREMEPAVVVGIGYGPGRDWWQLRARDLTQSPDRSGVWGRNWRSPGGADRFGEFLETELLPFLEGAYRLRPGDRLLAGLSFGGLFAWHVMLTRPALFPKIIAVSPALAWDSARVLAEEARFAESHRALGVEVFTAVGLEDDSTVLAPWRTLNRQVEARRYGGLRLTTLELPAESHVSAWAVALQRGLRALLPPPRVARP
jgi:hypothetical protein